jgi:hypothetical protein
MVFQAVNANHPVRPRSAMRSRRGAEPCTRVQKLLPQVDLAYGVHHYCSRFPERELQEPTCAQALATNPTNSGYC